MFLIQGGIEMRQVLAVVNQHARFRRAQQHASACERQQRREMSAIGVPWPDAKKLPPVEAQEALAIGGDE